MSAYPRTLRLSKTQGGRRCVMIQISIFQQTLRRILLNKQLFKYSSIQPMVDSYLQQLCTLCFWPKNPDILSTLDNSSISINERIEGWDLKEICRFIIVTSQFIDNQTWPKIIHYIKWVLYLQDLQILAAIIRNEYLLPAQLTPLIPPDSLDLPSPTTLTATGSHDPLHPHPDIPSKPLNLPNS